MARAENIKEIEVGKSEFWWAGTGEGGWLRPYMDKPLYIRITTTCIHHSTILVPLINFFFVFIIQYILRVKLILKAGCISFSFVC